MSRYNLGRVLPKWKGDFSATEHYDPMDVVLYNGSSYVALCETHGNTPTDTPNDYWSLMVKGTQDDVIDCGTFTFDNLI